MFCNRNLVNNIHNANHKTTIARNGDKITVNKRAHLKNHEKVWFDKKL